MCGRFFRDVTWDQYLQWLRLIAPLTPQNDPPEMDIRPTSRQWVARPDEGGFTLERMRWGLVPFWHKGDLKAFKLTTFNARAETIVTAPVFREAFKRRRCLVPATGWYEWTGDKGSKTKWAIARPNGAPFMFAGLWDVWTSPEDERVESFTIVTQAAVGAMTAYHTRAPVVLEDAQWEDWLSEPARAAALLAEPIGDRFSFTQAD